MAVDEIVSAVSDENESKDERVWDEKAAAAKQAMLAGLTTAAAAADIFDLASYEFSGPLEELADEWGLPVPTVAVGVPVKGPMFVRLRVDGESVVLWVRGDVALVQLEDGDIAYAGREEGHHVDR